MDFSIIYLWPGFILPLWSFIVFSLISSLQILLQKKYFSKTIIYIASIQLFSFLSVLLLDKISHYIQLGGSMSLLASSGSGGRLWDILDIISKLTILPSFIMLLAVIILPIAVIHSINKGSTLVVGHRFWLYMIINFLILSFMLYYLVLLNFERTIIFRF